MTQVRIPQTRPSSRSQASAAAERAPRGRAGIRRGRALVAIAALAPALSCGDPARPPLATGAEMMEWIARITSLGIRRPGFEAGAQTERWIADELERFGVEDVRLDPVSVQRFEERSCHLELQIDGERSSLDCFPMPFSPPAGQGELSGEFALDRFDQTRDASDLEGKIAVYANTHTRVPAALLRDRLATRSYDPSGDFDTLIHVQPFGPRILNVMAPAAEAGARAFVGVVGQRWESNQYYVPYDAVPRPIPGVWISPADGRALLEALRAGERVEGSVQSESSTTAATAHNVIGTLPGASEEWVIVGTHHDAPWYGAVEDGSGVALVLAQARYWSRIPAEERPFNLLFLFTAGHMAGGQGIRDFVVTHRDRIDRSVVAIHLEHVAREPAVEGDALRPGDDVTPRWWFTSRIEPLEDAVEAVLQAHDLRRSLLLPPNAFFENPPTDGALLYPTGVPIVQLLAAPEYLVDVGDTLEMVHEPSLVPISRAVIDLIESLSDWDGARLRALDARPAP